MTLERLWAGWRSEYVAGVGPPDSSDCVLCGVLAAGEPAADNGIVYRGPTVAVVLNAYPYTSGHVMVMPVRHVAEPEELTEDEAAELWAAVTSAVAALRSAYQPDGLNIGANLGRVAGAGVPGHFHMHALPRWSGDTNFMTSVAEARVLPEALPASWERLRTAWPGGVK